jgi:uncharacterized protein (TIGR03382 family)
LGRELQRWRGMRANPITTVTFLTLGLGACGGVHGIPIDKTATDIAQAVCPQAWTCCTADQLSGNDQAGTNQADCEAKTAEEFRGRLAGVQRSEDQGRARYEQTKVDRCLDTIRNSTCGELNMTNHLTGVPNCGSFVTPLVPPGGKCGNDYECIDSWCKHEEGSLGDGVCTLGHVAGETCAADHCGSGLSCDPKGTDQDHSDDVCVEPRDNGATCSDPYECKSGICNSSGGSGMTCVADTNAKCFYSNTGCSAAGNGTPGLATILLLAGLVGFATSRRARARNRA